MATYTRPVVNQGLLTSLGSRLAEGGAEMPSLKQMMAIAPSLTEQEEMEYAEREERPADPNATREGQIDRAGALNTLREQLSAEAGKKQALSYPNNWPEKLAGADVSPAADLVSNAMAFRQYTEGNIPNPYKDAGGVAIGQGLNLTVQDPASLRVLVGGNEELFKKLSPLLGRKWGAISPQELSKLSLSKEELTALNSAMAQASLDAVAPYAGNLSPRGVVVLSDLQHWAGTNGLKSARSSKLGVKKGNVRYNPISSAILSGPATDERLLSALRDIEENATEDFIKQRVKKDIEYLTSK